MQLTPCAQTFINYLEYDSKFVEKVRWGKRNRWHMFSKPINIWDSLSVSLIKTEPLDGRWKSKMTITLFKIDILPYNFMLLKVRCFCLHSLLKKSSCSWVILPEDIWYIFSPFYTWRYFVLISTVWCSIKKMNLLLWFQLRFAFQKIFKIGLLVFNK